MGTSLRSHKGIGSESFLDLVETEAIESNTKMTSGENAKTTHTLIPVKIHSELRFLRTSHGFFLIFVGSGVQYSSRIDEILLNEQRR